MYQNDKNFPGFSLVSENKVLCHPSSVDSLSTSAGTEDHVSMGGFSARKAVKVVENVERGIAKQQQIFYDFLPCFITVHNLRSAGAPLFQSVCYVSPSPCRGTFGSLSSRRYPTTTDNDRTVRSCLCVGSIPCQVSNKFVTEQACR